MTNIRAIAFDAVGTLIHPAPPAWQVYGTVARQHGSLLTEDVIRSRFRAAFAEQEELDRQSDLRTSEERELRRWRTIVAQVLDDVIDASACFAALYEHFRRPDAWRVTPDAESLLQELKGRGIRLALASNYDERLRCVWHGLQALHAIDVLVISSEVGWRKPAPQFFTALCRELGVPPGDVAFIGDDPVNDVEGARCAGLRAHLYDPALGLGMVAAIRQASV
jgi:putative hydrolase of the HAD superfamily